MAKHLAEIEILGSSFTVQSEESTEHLAKIIDHFSSRVAEARRAMPQAGLLRVAIVSGLNITDELFKALQAASDNLRDSDASAQIASRLIGMIDQTLVDGEELTGAVPTGSAHGSIETDLQIEKPAETAE